ncbi:MAG: hypothetical protein ACT4P9_08360 [Betaproteobacteria bacterium]
MHVEIVAPALLASQGGSRHSALELLLARGRRTHDDPLVLEGWLAREFGQGDAPLPAGALTALAGGLEPGEDSWLRADPVHLRLQRDSMMLVPAAGFDLSRAEADALADAVNRHFGASFSVHVVSPAAWALRAKGDAEIEGRSPLALAGQDVNANLPAGTDAARWHSTLNEVQMLLHEHPVNEAREVPLNSLWFWGAGRLPKEAAVHWQSMTADDPVALGLAKLAAMRHRALPAGAGEWLERLPETGRHMVLLDQLAAASALRDDEAHAARLGAMEAGWFAPLLAALKSGRIGMVTVHMPDAGLSVETVRGDLRRFWRRPRPLAAYAA